MAKVMQAGHDGNIITQISDGMGNFFSAFKRTDEQREEARARMRNPNTSLDEIRFWIITGLVFATILTTGINSYFTYDNYVPTLGVWVAGFVAFGFMLVVEILKVKLGIEAMKILAFGWWFRRWIYAILLVVMGGASTFIYMKSIKISTKGMEEFAVKSYKKEHPVSKFDPVSEQKRIAETTKSGDLQKNISLAMTPKGLDATGNLVTSERGLKTADKLNRSLDKRLDQEQKLLAVSQAEHDRQLAELDQQARQSAAWTKDFGGIGEYAQIFLTIILAFVSAALSAKNKDFDRSNGSRDTNPRRNRDTNQNVSQNQSVSQRDTDATADKKDGATLDSTEILRWSARQIKGDLANLKNNNGNPDTVGGRISKLLNKMWGDATRSDFEPDYDELTNYIKYLEQEVFPVMAAKNVRYSNESGLLDQLYKVRNEYVFET